MIKSTAEIQPEQLFSHYYWPDILFQCTGTSQDSVFAKVVSGQSKDFLNGEAVFCHLDKITIVSGHIAGLPAEAKARKAIPICTGVLDYFPDALAAVAEVSRIGNEQHNPGQPLHWAKEKSADHEDALLRHLVDRGKLDSDGARHSAKVAWRALALLQTELEKARK